MPEANESPIVQALRRLAGGGGLFPSAPPPSQPATAPYLPPAASWAEVQSDPLKALANLVMGAVDPWGQPKGMNTGSVGGLLGAALPLASLARGAKAGAAAQGARLTRDEAVAAGLWHPIGEGKRLSVPVPEMRFTATDAGASSLPPVRILDPESMSGAAIVPAIGDRTSAGRVVTHINDVELPNPVQTYGGPDFMRTHDAVGAAWASDKGAASRLSKVIRRAAEASAASGGSGEVYMVYMPMGHGATDFSTMMSDALFEQISAGRIPKRALREFDSVIRQTRPEWVGVNSPSARQQLQANGELRHAFTDATKLDQFQSAGFPDLPTTRAAITDPKLLNAESYVGGQSVAKMDPSGRTIAAPDVPHPTYNTQLAGRYAGAFDKPLSLDRMFPDFVKGRRIAGKDPLRDLRSFMMSTPFQVVTPEWVAANKAYLESVGMVALPVAAHHLLSVVDGPKDDASQVRQP